MNSDEGEALAVENVRLRDEVYRLRKLIERDRTGLAKALASVRGLTQSWGWVPAGEWGCYDWQERTEAALRAEIGQCFDEIEAVVTAALQESGDRVKAAFEAALTVAKGGS